MGAAIIGIIILLSGFGCVGMIFLDYHKRDNFHKAILYIICFFLLLFVFTHVLLPVFSFYIVLLIPGLLVVFLALSKLFR